MNVLSVVVRTLVTLCKTILKSVHIFAGVNGKQQSAGATLLSCCLSKIADSSTYSTCIVHDAAQFGMVVNIVKKVRNVTAFYEQKFVFAERCVLSHNVHVGSSDTHHFAGGIHRENGYWLFLSFFLVRELFKHSHLESTENLSSRTAQSDEDVVSL